MLQKLFWMVLAAIHLLPAMAFFRPEMIGRLYGVERGSPAFLLLHHRAALFLAILVLCLWAAFDPASRRVASIGVGVSMISFLILYSLAGSPAPLRNIALADLAGLPFLAFVTWKAFAA